MTSIQFENFDIGEAGAAPASRERARGERGRRCLNLVVAGLGLLFAAPLMLLIAAAIKLTSRGPAIFKQTRVGVNRRNPFHPVGNCRRDQDIGGTPFTIYKFRTMSDGSGDAQVWATPDDPRVTRVGRFLRKYRLDELPQLFNVLKGDMNLVGPRPEQPEIFGKLQERVERYAQRQKVLPGITGWAQINHHYDRSEDDVRRKVSFDLEYVEKRSSLQDIKIMAKTVPVMVFRKGAW